MAQMLFNFFLSNFQLGKTIVRILKSLNLKECVLTTVCFGKYLIHIPVYDRSTPLGVLNYRHETIIQVLSLGLSFNKMCRVLYDLVLIFVSISLLTKMY